MPESLGRYELIAEIGRGGMADVKLAIQRGPAGFEKLVVLKLVHEELANDKQIVDMLLAEAKLSAQIKHPNVVDVYELGEAEGRYFIAMEYLEGESLLSLLDKGAIGKRLDPLSMARLIADAAEGLEAAHTLKSRDGKPLGIVHHDISLGNIFVLYAGQVKLLDFGVAKASRQSAAKVGGERNVWGKLAYMAPEKLDERPGDHRSDIWSLGCVLWEALTHKRLFKGSSAVEIMREVRYVKVPAPSTVASDVPAALDPIVLRALERDPARRYASAKQLAVALEEVLTAEGYPAKNYKIATYMMQTFADVIAARERLLRDVHGPERPSAEVIDAAFGDAPAKRESLPSIDHLLDPVDQVVLPEGSTGAVAAVPDAVTAADPVDDDPQPVHEAPGGGARARAGGRRRRLPYAIGGVAAVLAVGILAARSCGGSGGDTPGERTAVATGAPASGDAGDEEAAGAIAGPTEPVVADATPATADAADELVEIEMPPEEASRPEAPDAGVDARPADKPARRKPTRSAQQLYAEGLAAWNRKDRREAYRLWTEGRRANSRYANNWYGLGLVHDKAGRKADARTAYERYLKLAPNAPNSAKLRDHIKRNLL